MNSRERVLAALNHRQPDRPPRDLGGTTTTTIHPIAYRALKRHLGLDEQYEMLSVRSLLVRVEQPIIARFGLDLLPVISPANALPLTLNEENAYVDRWGIERRQPESDGHFYVTGSPLATAQGLGDIAAHPWFEPNTDFSALTAMARRLRETTDKALVLNLDIGIVHLSQFIRGFDTWLMDLVNDPQLAAALMDRILDIWLVEAEAMLKATRGYVDVALYADDIAVQDRTMFSRRVFHSLIRPRFKRIFDLVKSYDIKLLYHCCGNISAFIGDLVDLGIDALNPVQVSAGEMGDTARLKRTWGQALTFWGGIDTQHVLPRGTPQDVRAEVWRRLDDLAGDGGYVLASVHDIQAEVPPENICAMFDAAEEWTLRRG